MTKAAEGKIIPVAQVYNNEMHVSLKVDIWWQIVKQSAMMPTLILNWIWRLLNE